MELGSATIETEILDGGTNEQLAALIDPFKSDPEDSKGEKLSWKTVAERLGFYAKRLRGKLEGK